VTAAERYTKVPRDVLTRLFSAWETARGEILPVNYNPRVTLHEAIDSKVNCTKVRKQLVFGEKERDCDRPNARDDDSRL